MYNSSKKFSDAIEQNGGRTFKPKLIFDGFELESEIKSVQYDGGSNGENQITIGSAVSAKIEIEASKISHVLTKQNFEFDLGILCSDEDYEFVPIGKFNAEKPETTDYSIKFTAYDNMVLAEKTYASSLTYPTTTTDVMQEISKLLGISFVTDIESITINNPSADEGASNSAFAGYTIREAIGYIAGLYGKFAVFNRNGDLEFKWYEDNDYNLKIGKTYSFTKDERDYSIDKLIVIQNQETEFKAGNGTDGISCSNPFATQSIVNSIYEKIGGFAFRKGSVSFLGDCRIDPWDIVTVEDLFGNTYKLPVMSISHSIDGGLTTNIESFSNDNDDVSDSFSGPVTKAMERTYAQLLVVNKLIADRVTADYVEANYVKTKELDAVQANIETAVITNLQGKFATIEYLEANYATLNSLSAANAKIDVLEATALTASSAVITTLKSSVADINTLLFGTASGGSLSTEFSNSVVSLIGDAQIKSAMIESLDASKITALDINTTNVKVHSNDGKSQWKDNTIQISDANRVRVQIGKDANADYNMYVWDKDGNLMFDAIGLTEKGINRPVIRDDMVKDDANISAEKLDVSSLFNVINNDGSHTLKSSKIYVDSDNQTLDVSFKTITTKTETAVSTAATANSNATTAINKAQSVIDRADSGEFKGDKGDKGATGSTGATGLKALQATHNWHGTFTTVGATANCYVSDFNRTPVVGDTFSNLDGSSNTGTWKITAVSGNSVTMQLLSYVSSKGATGAKGDTGATGKGVASITPQYYLSTSNTTQSGGSWSNSKPTWVTGRYYWTRDKMDWTDGSTTYSTPQLATDLNNLYSSLKTVTETVTTQGTNISTIQGQISSKVWQQDITTAVTSLQIGGRNLLTKTNKGATYWVFNKKDGTVSVESYETIGVRFNCTVASSGWAVVQYTFSENQVKLLKPNTEYILSFDIISSNTVAAGARICQGDATDMLTNEVAFHVDAGTKWVHKSIKLTTNALTNDKSGQFVYITGFAKVGTVCFKNLKLEEGNKATDWTPAPEDIDSSISSVEGKVTTVSNQYTSLNQSLTSLTATVNSNTTKINSKADGSTVTNLQSTVTNLQTDLSGFKTTVSSTYATKATLNSVDGKFANYSTTAQMNSAIDQKASSITSTVSSTYATKTEMNKKTDKVYATFSSNGNTAGYCLLAQLKVTATYKNADIVFGIIQRGYGVSELHLGFENVNSTDPGLYFLGKTGKNRWFMHKSATSTWNLYVMKSESYDVIKVTSYANPYDNAGINVTWKCENSGGATGWTEAVQLAAYYGVDSTNGGTSGSNSLPTSGALYSTTTIAKQTANKFQWIVKSGTSATDFTITDRLATLTANYINLNGLVTFQGLDASAQKTINSAYSVANTAKSTADSAWSSASSAGGTASQALSKANGIATNIYTTNTTTIDGGKITTGTITADKIKVDSLQAISAKIGGFTIASNSLTNGTWGTDGSVMMCTGTAGKKSIGGSGEIDGWCFAAGSKFGVTKAGALYTSSISVTGGKIDLNASSVTNASSATTAYLRTAYSSTDYVKIASGKNESRIDLVFGKTKIAITTHALGSEIQMLDKDGNSTFQFSTENNYLMIPKISAKTSVSTGELSVTNANGGSGNIKLTGAIESEKFKLIGESNGYVTLQNKSGGYTNITTGVAARIVNTNGTGYMPVHASGFVNASSKRYKISKGFMKDEEANKILDLDIVHFDYKNGAKNQYGLYAEDTYAVLPGIVYKDSQGVIDGVDYTKLIPFIVKKVQMQDREIKRMEKLITHLIGIVMKK